MGDLENSIIGLAGAGIAAGVGLGVMRATTRIVDDGSCGCHKRQARKSQRRSKR